MDASTQPGKNSAVTMATIPDPDQQRIVERLKALVRDERAEIVEEIGEFTISSRSNGAVLLHAHTGIYQVTMPRSVDHIVLNPVGGAADPIPGWWESVDFDGDEFLLDRSDRAAFDPEDDPEEFREYRGNI